MRTTSRRYTLAPGRTIFEGWQSLGSWATWYFGIYIVVWGFVYGAAAMAGTGLPLHSLFPFLGVTWWGILSGLVGLALVWWGRYSLFELVCTALVALMFVSMVGAAILTVPNLPDMATGLVPTVPGDGGIIYVLSLAGGVGGTITLAAYGYWLREKGWTTPRHMRVMRIDNNVAHLVTGLFVVATLIVAFFMPCLAVTLLWILNTDRTPAEWRNKVWSNAAMALCALAFGALAVNEILKQVQSI